MLTIEMLPARYGDCLWVECGDPKDPTRILIDGGVASCWKPLAARIAKLPKRRRRIDLLVITHVDADHIEGAVKLLQHATDSLTIGDVWFNGWKQLGRLGPVDGEIAALILERHGLAWNAEFDAGPVMVPDDGPLPTKKVGDAKITLLSPYESQLKKLRTKWKQVVEEAGFKPGSKTGATKKLKASKKYRPEIGLPLGGKIDLGKIAARVCKEDTAVANGSSIAFLLESGGRSILCGADSFPTPVATSLKRLARTKRIDALKLSHHGSRGNTSGELLDLARARHYLISTNGEKFGHPDEETLARILLSAKSRGEPIELWFNYANGHTQGWWSTPRSDVTLNYPRKGDGIALKI